MAKTDYKFSPQNREKRVKECAECDGAPPVDTFNLQGMCGQFCTKCMEVVNWTKPGKPTIVKAKVTATIDRPQGMSQRIDIEIPFEPGKQLDFSNLTIKE